MDQCWCTEVSGSGDVNVVGEIVSEQVLSLVATVGSATKTSAPHPLDIREITIAGYVIETPEMTKNQLTEMANDNLDT